MAVKTKTKPQKAAAASERTKGETNAAPTQLKIRLVRSVIGRPPHQREVVKGLGLRKLNSEVIRADCPETRGMIQKIPHLIEVKELKKK
jgi:large subunit ribosomal protein L30